MGGGPPGSGGSGGSAAGGFVIAYTGGTSIAIRWTAVAGATAYDIVRDGTQIAVQTPGYHADFPEKDGDGFIDPDVKPGVAYLYVVTAVGAQGTLGEVGETTVTVPASTTPVPVITIDTSRAADLAGWMQDTVQPFLETWYPKVGDALAQPSYAPAHAITLTIDPDYDGVAYTSGASIVMSAAYARANPKDLGAWLHESTHVVQSYQNVPGWITEGMADYAREFILHDRDPNPPGPGNTYLTGYSEGSSFLAWIAGHYDATFVRELNATAHQGTYSDAFFTAKTGKSIDALWTEMVGAPLPAAVHFVALANECLRPGDATTNHVQIAACDGSLGQGFGVIHNSNGTISVAHGHACLDVAGSATSNGAVVWMYACNGTGAQQWVQLADGSLRNPESNRCLDDPSSSTTDGTSLELYDCNGTDAQRFSTLP